MTLNGWFQILLFFLAVLAVTKPMGVFIARVFSGEKTFLDPLLRPVERLSSTILRPFPNSSKSGCSLPLAAIVDAIGASSSTTRMCKGSSFTRAPRCFRDSPMRRAHSFHSTGRRAMRARPCAT